MTKIDSRSVWRGKWVAILFGLIFGGVGIGVLVFAVVPAAHDAWRMQSWVQVPAELLHVELAHSSDSDSVTYQARARYRYMYHDRTYTGERVGIHGGYDNVGRWQHDTYQALRRSPLSVWVNPQQPDESIFDRSIRWGLMTFWFVFVFLFGGVGLVVAWAMLRARPAAQATMPIASMPIRSQARTATRLAWFLAIVWNAVSMPAAVFVLPQEVAKGNMVAWLILIFPLIGMLLLYHAVRRTLEWRRFGDVVLILDPATAAVGQHIAGYVELRLPFRPDYRFTASLSCIHVYRRRSGNETRTEHKLLWQDQQAARLETGMRGTRVRFEFAPPMGLPASSPPQDDHHVWTLKIHGDLPGVDFDRSFDIPVVESGVAAASVAPAVRTVTPLSIPESIVRIRPERDGILLHYPVFRHLGMALVLLLAGGMFAGGGVFVAIKEDARGAELPLVIILSAVGGFIALAGIYQMVNSLTVRASRAGVDVVRRVFGLARHHHVSVDEIASLDKRIGMQGSRGGEMRAYYDVRLITRSGKRVKVGDGLPSASAADRIIALIEEAIGAAPKAASVELADAELDWRPTNTPRVPAEWVRWIKWLNTGIVLGFAAWVLWHFRDLGQAFLE